MVADGARIKQTDRTSGNGRNSQRTGMGGVRVLIEGRIHSSTDESYFGESNIKLGLNWDKGAILQEQTVRTREGLLVFGIAFLFVGRFGDGCARGRGVD